MILLNKDILKNKESKVMNQYNKIDKYLQVDLKEILKE